MLTLDRIIALVFLTICLIYGYTAFFAMDPNLAPFMRRNPIWPSTFPKVLAARGIISALWVLVTSEVQPAKDDEIDYRRLREYKLGQAAILIGLMIAYALCLFPLGFILSTILFLMIGSIVLGERRVVSLALIASVAAVSLWYLVQEVLGIFLRPWPWFVGV